MKRNLLQTRRDVDPAGLAAVTAGVESAPVTTPIPDPLDANILKTRHDTVKNTISNIR